MKIKFIVLILVAVVIGGLIVTSKLQLEETIISARYEMLACEGCNHMTVERSKGGGLNGETIIPVSNTVDIEQLIDGIVLTREPLCLRGKLYRFNPNLFDINPGGKRFEVIANEPPEICSKL